MPDLRQKASQAARKARRARLGKLAEQVVAPKTLARYRLHVYNFIDFLIALGVSYPSGFIELDNLVCRYVESLWESGDPKGWASDCLSGLGHFIPPCKPWLVGAWRLHAAWGRAELPLRAAPFTPLLVYSLAELAHRRHWNDTAVLLIVGFCMFPRSAELFSALKGDFVFDHKRSAVWSLPLTKSGQRTGAKESLVVRDRWVVSLLRSYLEHLSPGDKLTRVSGQTQRNRLKVLTEDANLAGNFQWYSCRRGGATHMFRMTGNLSQVCHVGRWNSPKTARIYISDAVAALAEIDLETSHRRRLTLLAAHARPDWDTI